MRLLVVGGDAAGMSAASHVSRARDDADVVVVERGRYTSYSMCGIPYLIGGEVDDAGELVVKPPDAFRAMGITVHLSTEALAVDADGRRVRVRDGAGEDRWEPYDALLLATGAQPRMAPLPGLDRWGHVVHTLEQGEHLRRHFEAHAEERRVVVVGAGYIGIEIAEALVRAGLDATIVDRSPQVMNSLDPDMAEHVERALVDYGIDVRLGEELLAIEGEVTARGARGSGCHEAVTSGGRYPADAVVVALGGTPDTALAESAGCAVGRTGAVLVDDRMRTSVPGVWAAGDLVESHDLVAGLRRNVQLGTHANKQGKVAGIVIAGGDARFPGVVGTAVTKVCRWEIGRTGLSEADAHEAGVDYETVTFDGTARAGYMPDAGQVFVKMMAERGTGRVLGAQLVGTGNVAKRVDVAATWCQLGVSVQDAQLLDLSYAPPFGGVWDLLQVGARKLTKQLGLSPQL